MINKIKVHKDFFILFLGSGVSKAISILSYPIISRMFNSTDFALYSIYSSILSAIFIYSTGRYFNALYNSNPDNENVILSSCFYSMILLLIFLCFLIGFSFNYSGNIIGLDYLRHIPFLYILIIPFLCVFSAILDVSRVIWVRDGKYKYISYVMSITALTMVFFQVFLGYLEVDYSLLIGMILSNLIGSIYCIFVCNKNIFKFLLFTKKNFYQSMKYMGDNLDYPLFNGLSALVSTYSLVLILYLIEGNYGLEVVGFFAMAVKLVKLPTSFFSSSVLEYLSNKVVNTTKSLKTFLFYWGGGVFIIGIIYIFFIIIFYPMIIQFFLGDKWGEVGELSKFIVFPITFNTLILGFFMQIGSVTNIQKVISIISVFSELMLVVILLFFRGDFYLMLAYYNVLYGICCFLFVVFCFWFSKANKSFF